MSITPRFVGAALALSLLAPILARAPAAAGEKPARQINRVGPDNATRTAAMDRHGDPLPASALARLGTTRFRPGGHTAALAFSPDGKMLASADHDYTTFTIHLWDVATGKEVRHFKGPGEVGSVAFSPDGETLVSGSGTGKTICVWDVATGTPVLQFGDQQRLVKAVAFSLDGKLLASGSADQTVRLWESATGREIRQFTGHEAEVFSVVFLADGKTLASAGKDGTVRAWEFASGVELRQFKGPPTDLQCVAYSPDGKILAMGCGIIDRSIRLWDMDTGKRLPEFQGRTNGAESLVFSGDGKLLASTGTSHPGEIRIWDVASGKEVRQCKGTFAARLLAIAPDGKLLASVGINRAIQVWDLATAQELAPGGGHQSSIFGAAYSPDGKSIATLSSHDGGRLWDAATGRELGLFGEKMRGGFEVAFCPDGRGLAYTGGYDNSVRLWDLRAGFELRRFQSPQGSPVFHAAVAPDGKLLASSGGGSVRLWEIATGKQIHHLPKCSGEALAFSPDCRLLATGGFDRTLRLWDCAAGTETRQLAVGFNLCSLAFAANGKTLFSAGFDGSVFVWDVASGKQLRRFQTNQGAVRAIALAPDDRTLVTAGDGGLVRVWEVLSGNEICRWDGHRGSVWSVAFAPDGRSVVSGSFDSTALVWDVTGRMKGGQLQPADLTAANLKSLWSELGGEDAAQAQRALWTFVAAPKQAVPFFQARLTPFVNIDSKRIHRLIADLDDDAFVVRERATAELHDLSDLAEPALTEALKMRPSLEAQRRIEQILSKLNGAGWWSRERLRTLRAIDVLEKIGNEAARRLLDLLAQGGPETESMQEARFSLERLAKHAVKR